MLIKPFWLKKIKVLIWDFDGTLYREKSIIKQGIHRNVIKAIAKKKKISLIEAEELQQKTYAKYKSNTQVLLHLGIDKKFSLSGLWYKQLQEKYLEKDQKLVDLFNQLPQFRHLILTNSEYHNTIKKLHILGLKPAIFEKIYTNRDFQGKLKPDLYPFKLVLEYTKLRPKMHLFIGDSDIKEMIPAKKVAMKTCIVWSKSKVADISLETAYNVVKLWR